MSLFRKKRPIRHGVMLDKTADGSGCERCDADCCRGFPTIELTGEEYLALQRLGAQRLLFTLNGKFYLNIENGCEFLVGNRCGIYQDRPEVCRRFACRERNGH